MSDEENQAEQAVKGAATKIAEGFNNSFYYIMQLFRAWGKESVQKAKAQKGVDTFSVGPVAPDPDAAEKATNTQSDGQTVILPGNEELEAEFEVEPEVESAQEDVVSSGPKRSK